MKPKTLLLALALAGSLGLAACGGGGGGGTAGGAAGGGLPEAAARGVDAFIAFMQQVVADLSEGAEPLALPDTLPTSDTAEPAMI